MNKKWTPHIIAAAALVVFIVLGLACASSPEEKAKYEAMNPVGSWAYYMKETNMTFTYILKGNELTGGSYSVTVTNSVYGAEPVVAESGLWKRDTSVGTQDYFPIEFTKTDVVVWKKYTGKIKDNKMTIEGITYTRQ